MELLEILRPFDQAGLTLVNGHIGRSASLDLLGRFLTSNEIVKGLPVLAIWGLWFWPGASRARIIAALPVIAVVVLVARALAVTLPFRERPLRAEGFDVVVSPGYSETILSGWSSLPSDHAALFFTLAACLWLVNRWVGVLALLHAAVLVSLPRVFVGLHFPSDVIAGALLGLAATVLLWPISFWAVRRLDVPSWFERYGYVFYPLLFIATWQMSTTFTSALQLVEAFAYVLGVKG